MIQNSVLWVEEEWGREKEQGFGKLITGQVSRTPTCISYLHSDGCLLGHSLVHADEGYVVV